jgi:glycosyltransferase involved in cell wall biosynthesis
MGITLQDRPRNSMRILYHHRTRATDAQRVHIREIVGAFRDLGHEVEVTALADTEAPAGQKKDVSGPGWGGLIRRIPFAFEIVQLGYNVIGLWMMLRSLRRQPSDFIYERYALFNFTGVLAARLTGKPIILEVNSPLAMELTQEKAIRAVGFAMWMERIICNAATKVIAVSGPLRRILIENGVDASRIVVMPNGVDLERLGGGAGRQELAERLGLSGRVTIGFVGWFRKWHGLEFLVEAFHQAGLEAHGAALLMIGDGPAMADLQEYVAKCRLQKSVIFTGAVAHEKIAPYLGLIDIAVQPAANEYCCPMKIIEYLALAKPIVAPRQENIEELIEDGRQGLLFTPQGSAELGDALQRLVLDPQCASRLGRAGLELIHERGLLWKCNAQRVIDLVAERRQPGPHN